MLKSILESNHSTDSAITAASFLTRVREGNDDWKKHIPEIKAFYDSTLSADSHGADNVAADVVYTLVKLLFDARSSGANGKEAIITEICKSIMPEIGDESLSLHIELSKSIAALQYGGPSLMAKYNSHAELERLKEIGDSMLALVLIRLLLNRFMAAPAVWDGDAVMYLADRLNGLTDEKKKQLDDLLRLFG